jgi:hypothetical protein
MGNKGCMIQDIEWGAKRVLHTGSVFQTSSNTLTKYIC